MKKKMMRMMDLFVLYFLVGAVVVEWKNVKKEVMSIYWIRVFLKSIIPTS
jgi:hypothetical protein